MPVRPCGNAFNFSGDSLCNSGGSGGGGGGGGAFTGRQFDCGNEVDQIYTRIPTGAWNGSPQGNNMCDQNSPNYSPQLSPGGQFSSPGRPMTFPQRSPNLNRSPQDPRNQSYGCNEASSPGSPNIGRPIKPSDFFTPPARAPQRGTHLTMATQIPQNQYNETYDQTSYLNLPDCEPAGRQMNAQQPGSRDRSYSPSGGAPCPCPSGTGAGAQSNVNMSRNQQGAASMSGQQQDTCCSRPMQRQAQQQLQQQQQQYVHQLIQQNLQIELARRNSPDCSVTRGVIPKRSDASFKASASAAKASSTPKASTSGLSMRELCNRKLRELQMENLVRDQYIPGVIQETLDGCENFNCVSFDLTLGQEAPDNKPQVDPLTLVEAFAMRIEYERNQVNCARERNAKGKEKETDPEKIKKNEKQEIDKYFACQNDSELNRAIAGLLRAERIEELTNDVKPLFTTEISKKETTLPGSELNNFQDLTMITYTSTTKPT